MALLIDKECKVAQAGGAELQSTIALDLDRLYGVLQTQADRICPGLPLNEALVETGLAPLFPTVLLRLQLPAVTALPPDQTPPLQFHDYLQHLAHMHQALAMSTQIQGDLPEKTHKYMAHQIALLYQSVSYSTLDMRDLKKKIEPQFDNIKKVTESADPPKLNDEQISFMHELTTEAIARVSDLGRAPAKRVVPWFTTLS